MSFDLQRQIRNNASQVREYVNDLYDWEEKINNQGSEIKIAEKFVLILVP